MKEYRRDLLCSVYMAEGIRVVAQNLAGAFGGSTLSVGLSQLMEEPKRETRTAGQIISHMKEKLQLIGEV